MTKKINIDVNMTHPAFPDMPLLDVNSPWLNFEDNLSMLELMSMVKNQGLMPEYLYVMAFDFKGKTIPFEDQQTLERNVQLGIIDAF